VATKTWQNGGVNNNWSTAGNWAEGSKPATGDDVVMGAAYNCTMDENSANLKSFDQTGYANTLSGTGNIVVIGATSATNNVILAGTNTMSGTINLSPSTASAIINFTSGGVGVSFITSTPSGTSSSVVFQDNFTSRATKTCTFTIASSVGTTDLNGKTVSGESSVNRLLVRSGTLGTSGTITINGGTFANADFRDIALSASTDLSAITGLSGDAGGNTNITFTTAATQTYTGGTGSWSDVTKWTSRVPLPQDNVLMSGVTGGTITADMPRLGKSIDWTGASGSPTYSQSVATTVYGSITAISSMTGTFGGSGITFEGRGAFTLTSAGRTFTAITVSMVGGSLSLQDAATTASGNSFTLNNGTLTSNGFSISSGSGFSGTGTATRALDISNSTVSLSASSGTPWSFATVTGLTFTSTGSTILISDTGASTKTFNGGGLTYNNLSISGGGAGAVIITGANTFNSIRITGGTKSITLPGSTNTTILSGAGLGNSTNLITFTSSAGSATVRKTSGILGWNYVSLTNIPSTGGAVFYAGANSTDGGGNTGWIFGNAPSTGGTTLTTYAAGPPFESIGYF